MTLATTNINRRKKRRREDGTKAQPRFSRHRTVRQMEIYMYNNAIKGRKGGGKAEGGKRNPR